MEFAGDGGSLEQTWLSALDVSVLLGAPQPERCIADMEPELLGASLSTMRSSSHYMLARIGRRGVSKMSWFSVLVRHELSCGVM